MDHRNGEVTVRSRGLDRRDEAESIERGDDGSVSVEALLAAAGGGLEAAAGIAPVADEVTGWTVDRLTEAMVSVATGIVGSAVIGPDTDLFESGATSVAAVECVAAIARELGVELSLDDVFADARPRRLAERWLATHAAAPSTTEDDDDLRRIMADVAGADSLPWARAPRRTAPQRILLTGATGFLGSHLLLDLLRHSDAHVVCLVRADSAEAATHRLGAALVRFALPWSAEVRRRITVLPGDIRAPRLGLSDEYWDALAVELDALVNVAAAVDFLRGYASLRQSNVLGPLTLAELAVTGNPKPLHHISSIAVFNEIGIESMGEDDPVAHIDQLAAGYDQSKWAAEAALRRAREHGAVVTLLRPGAIGGHTDTGANNPHDLSSALLGASSRFRTVPAFRYLNVAPVEWVSRVTAAIVCEPSAWGYNYHLTGIPSTLADVVTEMSLGGMPVRVQHWADWRTDTLDRIRTDPVPELASLALMLQNTATIKLFEASMTAPAVRNARTLAFVTEHGLPAPTRYDARAQQQTFEALARSGLATLPHPDDVPYLWFPETMVGRVGALGDPAESPCTLSLRLSIASMYQLLTERRVDVAGDLTCIQIHREPLTVTSGRLDIRPQDGVPHGSGLQHPLLRYRLTLRDADGQDWWLTGTKTARARRDWWRQTRTVAVEIGRDGEQASLAGEVVVPADSYLAEQVDGIRVDPRLSEREQRRAKLIWLGWFGSQVGRGLAEPMLRAAAELLDLRPGATPKELP